MCCYLRHPPKHNSSLNVGSNLYNPVSIEPTVDQLVAFVGLWDVRQINLQLKQTSVLCSPPSNLPIRQCHNHWHQPQSINTSSCRKPRIRWNCCVSNYYLLVLVYHASSPCAVPMQLPHQWSWSSVVGLIAVALQQRAIEWLTLGLSRGMNGVTLSYCYSADYPTRG